MPRYLYPVVITFIVVFTFGCVVGGFIGWIGGTIPFTPEAGETATLTIFFSLLGAFLGSFAVGQMLSSD